MEVDYRLAAPRQHSAFGSQGIKLGRDHADHNIDLGAFLEMSHLRNEGSDASADIALMIDLTRANESTAVDGTCRVLCEDERRVEAMAVREARKSWE